MLIRILPPLELSCGQRINIERLDVTTDLTTDDAVPSTHEPRRYVPTLALANFGILLPLLTRVLVSLTVKVQSLVGTEAAAGPLSLILSVEAGEAERDQPKLLWRAADGARPADQDGVTFVDDSADADLVVLRLAAPYEERPGGFEKRFHSGSLEFATAIVDEVRADASESRLLLVIALDRAAVRSPLVDLPETLLVDFGASDQTELDAVLERILPRKAAARPASVGRIGRGESDGRTVRHRSVVVPHRSRATTVIALRLW